MEKGCEIHVQGWNLKKPESEMVKLKRAGSKRAGYRGQGQGQGWRAAGD